MSRMSRLAPRDLDALSAYADGALTPAERAAVEKRLEQEPALREALKEIRTTSSLLRALPQVRPPRNFTLTPEMAGVRAGWLRTPFLQLATAVAVVAFCVTVGIDAFGGMLPGAALRAAAPAQELAMEAPAESVAADALEAGAAAAVPETPLADKALVEGTAAAAPAPMEMLAATPTAEVLPEEYMSREAPTVGGAVGAQVAPTPAGTSIAELDVQPTVGVECEVCGPDLTLPTTEPRAEAAATPAPEGNVLTEEAAAQAVEPPAAEPAAMPTPEVRFRGGLPAVRWIEIGLGAVALLLGAVTLWARRRAR